MQIISIDSIVEDIRLANPIEWRAYEDKLSSFIATDGKVMDEVVTLAEMTRLDGIKNKYVFNPKKNYRAEKNIDDSDLWKWTKR